MEHLTTLPAIGIHTLAVLFLAAILAGWVDSIAGGGGLIGTPALLWAGVPPLQALATNKLQGSFGTLTAVLNYAHKGLVIPKDHLLAIPLTFLGAIGGVLAVQQIDASILARLIPILIMLFALYFMFSPQVGDLERAARFSKPLFAATAGLGIGFYDGFFGPGAGTFFTMAFISLLGYSLPRATASTKLLNFTSNIASLGLFVLSGQVIWLLGFVMAAGQVIGSLLGSQLAIKHGSRLIRPVLVVVSLLVSVRLLLAQ